MSSPSRPDHELAVHGHTQLAAAKTNLSDFISIQAHATAELVGFGWYPSDTAPNDVLALRRAYLASSLTGRPLPVSDEHSGNTVYGAPAANYAFRFWHDVVHVRLGCAFDLDGEITVARAQLDVLRAAGWGPGTLEFELLHADTLGQALCGAAAGAFPTVQLCFALRSVTDSLGSAIKGELQEQVSRATNAVQEPG